MARIASYLGDIINLFDFYPSPSSSSPHSTSSAGHQNRPMIAKPSQAPIYSHSGTYNTQPPYHLYPVTSTNTPEWSYESNHLGSGLNQVYQPQNQHRPQAPVNFCDENQHGPTASAIYSDRPFSFGTRPTASGSIFSSTGIGSSNSGGPIGQRPSVFNYQGQGSIQQEDDGYGFENGIFQLKFASSSHPVDPA